MTPLPEIDMYEDSFMELVTVEIKGVDSTKREKKAWLKTVAKLVVMELLMTHGRQIS